MTERQQHKELINRIKKQYKQVDYIRINKESKTVLVKLKDGREYTAKCQPNDTWDMEKGVYVALSGAMNKITPFIANTISSAATMSAKGMTNFAKAFSIDGFTPWEGKFTKGTKITFGDWNKRYIATKDAVATNKPVSNEWLDLWSAYINTINENLKKPKFPNGGIVSSKGHYHSVPSIQEETILTPKQQKELAKALSDSEKKPKISIKGWDLDNGKSYTTFEVGKEKYEVNSFQVNCNNGDIQWDIYLNGDFPKSHTYSFTTNPESLSLKF
jgi:hypothetical protein